MPQYPFNTPGEVAYNHIGTAGTYVVKAVPGALFEININSGTSGATIELFDQATTVTGTNVIAGPINLGTATVIPQRVLYGPDGAGIKFNNGLVVITTGTTDITMAYR